MLQSLHHREVGDRVVPGLPVRFSAFKPRYTGTPALGEHTGEVLTSLLGLSASEIQKLRDDGVLGCLLRDLD